MKAKKLLWQVRIIILGLTAHPKVKEAAIKAVEKYGTGCSGSRYLTGTLDLHIELEERLAKFFNREAVLLFSTGYQTAQGIIPTLVQRGEYVVSDKDNHACLVAGILWQKVHWLSLSVINTMIWMILKELFQKIPKETAKLVVSDGVFSTGGEIVDLPKTEQNCKRK